MNRVLIAIALLCGIAQARTFTATLNTSETPLSANSTWVQGGAVGLDWTNVNTTSAKAVGTQLGSESCPSNCNDSIAIVKGPWGNDQTCQITVQVTTAPTSGTVFQEAECGLRRTITAHSITGYEVNCSVSTNASNTYIQIIRWNGSLGAFTQLNGDGTHHCANGDVLKATIIGTTISAYLNNTLIETATDSTYSTGWPGIGLFTTGQTGIDGNFGITSVTLSDSNTNELWDGVLAPTYGTGTCNPLSSGAAGCGIDWSGVGIPGGIPSGSWTQCTTGACATANSAGTSATAAQINSALSACGTAGSEYVLLASGTYNNLGTTTITVPGGCELRGAAPNGTILSVAVTSGGGFAVLGTNLNTAPSTANDTAITGGLSGGSTSITVASAAHISIGSLLSISELNSLSNNVNIGGSEGNCTFCDGNYSGTRAEGQTVLVTGVSGTTITITPALYWTYGNTLPSWAASTNYYDATFITHGGHYYQQTATPATPFNCTSAGTIPTFSTSGGSVTDNTCVWLDKGTGTTTQPLATPFTPTKNAGISNLTILANNTGAGSNITVGQCQYCWVSKVVGNYTDGDHVDMVWSYGSEVVDSYFSNAYLHTPGTYDSSVRLAEKTSNSLVQNSIFERLHVSLMLEWGASGNVLAYNYMQAGFDTSGPAAVIGGIDYHGAHPQFNLEEGNVGLQTYHDSVWGTSANSTTYRNWLRGSMALDYPISSGRNTVVGGATYAPCTSPGTTNQTCFVFQASRAVQESYLATRDNFIGNVLGSTAQSSNLGYGSGVSTYNSGATITDALQWSTTRVFDTTVYDYTFGFGESSDTGTWALDSTTAFTTALFHGNYGNQSSTIVWNANLSHNLPASFYLASKPAWWGSSVPFPAIGPDITGGTAPGGHANIGAGNPAEYYYINVMGGSDGAPGSPLSNFNPGGTTQVATPTFSPAAGTYSGTQTVTISTTTGGATLCYTTDNSTPTANGAGTCTHGTTYSTPVSIASSLTLKAVGSLSGDTDSSVASGAYTITAGAVGQIITNGSVTITGGVTAQ